MTYIAFITVAFLLWRCGITLYNYFSRPYLVFDNNVLTTPLVAILIPARNEAHNIRNTLTALVACQYPHYKLFVLDDNSTDNTLAILQAFQQEHPTVDMTILQGTTLPPKWLGKNWACHQLAQAALQKNPEFLLFLDADVLPKKQLIEAAVQTSLCHQVALLSLFPDQIMQTWGEKIVVPIMHYLLLTLLPLRWIEQFSFPSMAAANGQFMFFDAKVYQQYLWHEKVKNKITEDIEIVKSIKSHHLKAMTLLPKGLIYCRMYLNGNEAVKGFSKNFLAGFGNSIFALLCYCFLITGAYVTVFYEWHLLGLIACFTIICIMNICLALLSQQSILVTILLHIPKILALCIIALRSIYVKLAGKNTWKGRKID